MKMKPLYLLPFLGVLMATSLNASSGENCPDPEELRTTLKTHLKDIADKKRFTFTDSKSRQWEVFSVDIGVMETLGKRFLVPEKLDLPISYNLHGMSPEGVKHQCIASFYYRAEAAETPSKKATDY